MTSAEKGTREREETKNASQCPEREREKTRQRSKVQRRERGKTVGLVTRCVLLLLYGGLLHHQNIKCPVGKRACAWVHPHFTFTADCRLNRATFPDFLLHVLVRPSRISFPFPPRTRSLAPLCHFFFVFSRRVHALFDITYFIRHQSCLEKFTLRSRSVTSLICTPR